MQKNDDGNCDAVFRFTQDVKMRKYKEMEFDKKAFLFIS